jgi:hypothetical protein
MATMFVKTKRIPLESSFKELSFETKTKTIGERYGLKV